MVIQKIHYTVVVFVVVLCNVATRTRMMSTPSSMDRLWYRRKSTNSLANLLSLIACELLGSEILGPEPTGGFIWLFVFYYYADCNFTLKFQHTGFINPNSKNCLWCKKMYLF